MQTTLLQMALLIACGAVWQVFKPAGLTANHTRQVVTTVVFYLLLPALILDVLWRADLGIKALNYTFIGVSGAIVGIVASWSMGKLLKFQNAQLGAVILAASFANVTFLGLPVLEQLFGAWARSVVIQIDLFAIAPFLYTFGIMLAKHYGSSSNQSSESAFVFLNTPPFWAAFMAVVLNTNGIEAPIWLSGVLQKLGAAVVPLMLFSLGLALSWHVVKINQLPFLITVVAVKLFLMPWYIREIVPYLDLAPPYQAAAVMDMAMPSMLMGVVLCDRYRLDVSLYAMLVTMTTALSLLTLPFWYDRL